MYEIDTNRRASTSQTDAPTNANVPTKLLTDSPTPTLVPIQGPTGTPTVVPPCPTTRDCVRINQKVTMKSMLLPREISPLLLRWQQWRWLRQYH